MASKLGKWLGTRTPDQLAETIARRPDALAAPAPRTLAELADRLQTRPSVAAAFQNLPLPAVQLVEVLQSFDGPSVSLPALARAVGLDAGSAELAATLEVLRLHALVWPAGDELFLAGPLWTTFPYPLRLGPGAAALLTGRTSEELRRIAVELGHRRDRSKADLLAAVLGTLTDAQRVRDLVAVAPPATVDLLYEVARHGPVVRSPSLLYGYGHSEDPRLEWALSRGLLVSDGWESAVMPREVGLALRGPDWHAPFTPQPPEPPLAQPEPEAIDRETAAAAGSAVAAVTAVLDACAATPVALLKAGGVGTRELRRLARTVGADEPTTRLWLELGHAAGLLGAGPAGLLPTDLYDEWREEEPADRLVPLLRAWRQLTAVPLVPPAPQVTPPPALIHTPYGESVLDLRHELLRTAADLRPGAGLADPADIVPLLAWRAPIIAEALEPAAEIALSIWQDAALLGLVAHGALTTLGHRLLDADDEALAAAARALLPPAVRAAVFQTDLTAVVPGTPTAALAALLDGAADRESAGGAAIWRFSASSVRRALDTGMTAEDLLGDLAVAAAGTIPQPLEYLVADTARRHGQVRVRTIGCVVHGTDEALLAEIAKVRSLAPLRLHLLAPTVLVSPVPRAEALALLRAAGYAPIGEDADGVALVERIPQQRAAIRRRRPHAARIGSAAVARANQARGGRTHGDPAPGGEPDPVALARELLSAPAAPARPRRQRRAPVGETRLDQNDPRALIGHHAVHLNTAEKRLLGHAVEHGGRVKIDYTNADGNMSARVIEPTAVTGHLIEAWCYLRDEERVFALARIDAVAPA